MRAIHRHLFQDVYDVHLFQDVYDVTVAILAAGRVGSLDSTRAVQEDAMTQSARITSTTTSEAERARQVEEAVHSVRMDGLDLAPEDAADAAEYVAGRISVDEYGSRTRARYGVPEEWGRGSGDPVAAFDAMWEAGTSLFGSYVWLAVTPTTSRPAIAGGRWPLTSSVSASRSTRSTWRFSESPWLGSSPESARARAGPCLTVPRG